MKYLQKSSKPNNTCLLFFGALIFFILSAVLGLLFGSVTFSAWELFFGEGKQILLYVRIPRTLASLFSGAALAVAGCITRSVLANRLASPSVIGVNSGAGLAVTLCTAFGIYGGWQLSCFSFIGAFLAVCLIAFCAQRIGGSKGTLILLGVGINSLLSAITSAVITLFPDIGLMSNDFRMGDFSGVTYDNVIPAAIIITVGLAITFSLPNQLDVIGLGEDNAIGLGLNTRKMRPLFLMLAAMLAGCAVSIAGLLSFVGLIVPHLVTLLGARSSRWLLPVSALVGGGLVTVSDLLARVIFSPYELPVGIIMAFLGAPFFIFLLFSKEEREYDQP